MGTFTITSISTRDARFKLKPGEGADSVHSNPEYSYAVTYLHTDKNITGTGLTFTLGGGNDLVCEAIEALSEPLIGNEIEGLMSDFGRMMEKIANHPQYRWLGPHKGVVHLALASIVNACFDLWAKSRGMPLWQLLLDLSPEALVNTLDMSYLEDVLQPSDAVEMLRKYQPSRSERESVLKAGYPGYDTSVGWFQYSDEQIRENVKKSVDAGFTAMKLKVGSKDSSRDIRRAKIVREEAGDDALIMLDVNQNWTLPQAVRNSLALAPMNPFWIEEPTHPDDVMAHQTLARAISPIKIALGEHVPNRIVFKNYLQAQAVYFCQVDSLRVAGISEFITVSILAKKFGVTVVPHVGDMGQIHQHLALFNHIALAHDALFLEAIPHLKEYFVHPAVVLNGVYETPEEPGSSSDLY